MADLIQDEIDAYDETTCPFNPEHKFLTSTLFRTHLPDCRDRATQQVLICDFDPNHIFADPSKLAYHLPRCLAHSFRIHFQNQRSIEHEICPFNYNHKIAAHKCPEAMDKHKISCPNVDEPIVKEKLAPQNMEEQVVCDVQDVEIYEPITQISHIMPTFDGTKRCVVSFQLKEFATVIESHQGRGYDMSRLTIDRLTSYDYESFPGFREIENDGRYNDLLVCGMHGLTDDEMSLGFYERFYSIVSEKPENTIGISTQYAGSDDIALLIVNNRDTTGLVGKSSKLTANKIACESIEAQTQSLLNQLQIAEAEAQKLQDECDGITRQILQNEHQIASINAKILEEKKQHETSYAERHAATRNILLQQEDKYAQTEQLAKTEYEIKRAEKDAIKSNLAQLELNFRSNTDQLEQQKKVMIDKLQQEELSARGELEMARSKTRRLEEARKARANAEETKVDPNCQACSQNAKNVVYIPCGHVMYCNVCISDFMGKSEGKLNQKQECDVCNEKINELHKIYAFS